jgi:hypothetical protein
MTHCQESNILDLAKPNLLHFNNAIRICELAVGKSGVPKHSRNKICAPRERQKHTAAGGIFQCLRLPSACNRDSSGVAWSAILFIASDSHIYIYIYIYMPRPYLYLNFITAQTYGHNFGPDALARKQCRARVLAALGRALGVGPHGPVPPHPSEHAKSERTRSVLVLVLAAVGTLQLRRLRRDGGASKCAGRARKRTYRYHLWLLS